MLNQVQQNVQSYSESVEEHYQDQIQVDWYNNTHTLMHLISIVNVHEENEQDHNKTLNHLNIINSLMSPLLSKILPD
jgi:hypothetical protein